MVFYDFSPCGRHDCMAFGSSGLMENQSFHSRSRGAPLGRHAAARRAAPTGASHVGCISASYELSAAFGADASPMAAASKSVRLASAASARASIETSSAPTSCGGASSGWEGTRRHSVRNSWMARGAVLGHSGRREALTARAGAIWSLSLDAEPLRAAPLRAPFSNGSSIPQTCTFPQGLDSARSHRAAPEGWPCTPFHGRPTAVQSLGVKP